MFTDQAAREYLEQAVQKFPSALSKQCIPADKDLWELANFEKFLAARRTMLTTELNRFLSNITEMQTTEGDVSISDMIAEGEHDGLEFKSSMRWDTRQNCLNKDLEKVVLKTIAAFNNGYGEGGMLIIGVDDDGEVLGLENDLSTLKGDDADAFELHFRNLVNAEFGIEYAAANIRIRFHEFSGQQVCSVEIAKGSKPLFIKLADKNGTKGERFFIRSGNSSQPINSPSEISAYIAKRFNSE